MDSFSSQLVCFERGEFIDFRKGQKALLRGVVSAICSACTRLGFRSRTLGLLWSWCKPYVVARVDERIASFSNLPNRTIRVATLFNNFMPPELVVLNRSDLSPDLPPTPLS